MLVLPECAQNRGRIDVIQAAGDRFRSSVVEGRPLEAQPDFASGSFVRAQDGEAKHATSRGTCRSGNTDNQPWKDKCRTSDATRAA